MAVHKVVTCREDGCGAEMVWARNPAGRREPFDADPVGDGPWVLEGSGRDVEAKPAPDGYTGPRYTSHFQTCARSRGWRRAPAEMPQPVNAACPRCGSYFTGVLPDSSCGECWERDEVVVALVREATGGRA